jgi:hypothetical protein
MTKNKNPNFIEYNHNPSGNKVGDCVFRAIGKALNISWEHCFEDLVRIAREQKSTPTYKDVYTEYLKIYTTINVMQNTTKGKKRLTANDVCKLKGSYIIRQAHHLTCVVDGKIYDTWDTGDRSSYKIWSVK